MLDGTNDAPFCVQLDLLCLRFEVIENHHRLNRRQIKIVQSDANSGQQGAQPVPRREWIAAKVNKINELIV